jgi:hypothetical protein
MNILALILGGTGRKALLAAGFLAAGVLYLAGRNRKQALAPRAADGDENWNEILGI